MTWTRLLKSAWLLGAAAVVSAGCNPKEYVCTQDQECVASNGGYGRCAHSHCAYSDNTCPTGWRFDDTAGADADQCVDSAYLMTPDAAIPDAAIPDAAIPDA